MVLEHRGLLGNRPNDQLIYSFTTYLKLGWNGAHSLGEDGYLVDKVFESKQGVLVDVRVFESAEVD